ncbi:hypothetical protein Hdeb2414_s0020g00556031 [Helianthus debilis subsp. tardiflorus]
MLDGLLGRNGFSSKWVRNLKSLIKPTRTRIAALRRREEAKTEVFEGRSCEIAG